MFRFLHSSDLHLGKRYGNLPEDLRGRLREARHMAIGRLAEQAYAHQATTILLAGDTFDTETPAPEILRQALAAMAEHKQLRWVIIAGNHDSLLADELWNSARRVLPENVLLALEPKPVFLKPDVAVLPAPCTTRRPGRDLTEWMGQAETPENCVRIGLAHGAVQSFSEDDSAAEIIAPDHASRAGLDYLALGDWHGQICVNDRTWYSGTPEPDRFKHALPGQALIVSVEGAGAIPTVVPAPTATFDWQMADLNLLSGDDPVAGLQRLLPAGTRRRQTLLRINASGRVRLHDHGRLFELMDSVAPEFALAFINSDQLSTDCEIDDLDGIDRNGALRQAANDLFSQSADETLAAGEREIAREALIRLFSYCEENAQ